MQIQHNATLSNITALIEGLKLLNVLTEEQFQASFKPTFQSTIGAHFRHAIEHYECFFAQLEQQHFCYDSRQRSLQLETDLLFTKQCLSDQIFHLRNLDPRLLTKTYTISDESIPGKSTTSLMRELVFLQSHTTHHYAIIAAIARSLGIAIDNDFGIAIATRNHQLNLDNVETIACVH